MAYQTPGISVTEVDTPNTTIILDRPTVIGLVGLAQGNEVRSEPVLLVDNDEYTLTGVNPITSPATSFVVRDINRLDTTYSPGVTSDYVLTPNNSTGNVTIKRSLYTTMTSKEEVVIVAKTTSPSGIVYCYSPGGNAQTAFNLHYQSELMRPSNNGTIAVTASAPGDTDISVQRTGVYSALTDYLVTGTKKIKRANATFNPTGCRIMDGQKVFVTYTTGNGATTYVDEEITLAGSSDGSATQLDGYADPLGGVDTSSIIVRNRAGMGSSTKSAVIFNAGPSGIEGNDFAFDWFDSNGDYNNGSATTDFTMTRNTAGPTTMGVAFNQVNVRIDYKFIPNNYYVPTLFTSYHEVEIKYGPAFDSAGIVLNPLSAGAYMCFRSGSNEVIAQPLFTFDNSGNKISGDESNTSHWETTLYSLEPQTAINVIVPIVGQSRLNPTVPTTKDELQYAIQNKFVNHINAMRNNGVQAIAVFGEDATVNGALANDQAQAVILQEHARLLGQQNLPERTVLVSPGAFKFANPVTGKQSFIGGQYVAATIAGMLANAPVQIPLTRKTVVGISDVAVYRNESEKTADSQFGLFVIESKNGSLRVRHAITTAVDNENNRELNAMRSKFFMINSIQRTLDSNVIGKLINDPRAPFIVRTQVMGSLNVLKSVGAITGYGSVSASKDPASITSMIVRFSYSLPYSVNNIDIVIALDTLTGTATAQ